MNEQEWLASNNAAAMLALFGHGWRGWAAARFTISDGRLRAWVEACRDAEPPCPHRSLPPLDSPAGIRAAVLHWTHPAQKALPDAFRAALLREIVGNPFRPVFMPWRCGRCGIPCGPPAGGVYCVKCWTPGCNSSCPWFTPAVLSLATAAYEECNPDGTLDPVRLAVLADALEEAGCDGEACPCDDGWLEGRSGIRYRCDVCRGAGRIPHPLIAHLRSPGPHVRGCHVVDIILGRS